jgi:hypothetical protein
MNLLDPSLEGFLWVLAIGLTALVLDVFFETQFLSIAALLGISIYFSLLFDVEMKWRVLITLLCWLGTTGLFYTGWKRAVAPLIVRGFSRGIPEAVHSAVGATAQFRSIDGKSLVYWNGDLWPAELDREEAVPSDTEDSEFRDGDSVIVGAVTDGIFRIKRSTSQA